MKIGQPKNQIGDSLACTPGKGGMSLRRSRPARIARLSASLASFISVTVGCGSSVITTPIVPPRDSVSEITEIDATSHLSRISVPNEGGTIDGFTLMMKTCGTPDNQSLSGAARQALVGLEQLAVKKREHLTLGSWHPWLIQGQARSDELPIVIAVYSIRVDDCVHDAALWMTSGDAMPVEQFGVLQSHFESYLRDRVYPIELTRRSNSAADSLPSTSTSEDSGLNDQASAPTALNLPLATNQS